MKPGMDSARRQLLELLQENEITAGMHVRVHRKHLIAFQHESALNGSTEVDDRVRLTRLGPRSFGLSVRRHTGRWQRTPFTGSMIDVVNTILELRQHLVARY